MKSMLIVDKPNNCDECDICYVRRTSKGERMLFCPIVGWMDIEQGKESINENCPLRPVPLRQVANDYDFEHYDNGVSVGWNRCLEAITGEVPNYAKTKGHERKEIEADRGESGE